MLRNSRFVRASFAALPLLSTLALAKVARAEDDKSLLSSVRLGEVWHGPKLSNEDLKGRVVLLDFWGLK